MKLSAYISETTLDGLLRTALAEDLGPGDVTTMGIIEPEALACGQLLAKSRMVVCGLPVAFRCFTILDQAFRFTPQVKEGEEAEAHTTLAVIHGPAAGMLMAERVALNLLQHLCGVATLTRAFVHAVAGTKAKIAATRKTLPGLRILDKYAVQVGGGIPHRRGLFDGILIKDNHITLAGGIAKAVERARSRASHLLKIEVEVSDLRQVEEALAAGVDVIMLDNMSLRDMAEAVKRIKGRALVEASGGITLENVSQVAATGVDLISVGALTHSAPAADISMLIVPD